MHDKQFKKGMVPWNKGKVGMMPTPWNKGVKKATNTGRTQFKKGEMVDDSHHAWKGDNVSYVGLHQWVRRKLGRPVECLFCSKNRLQGMIYWASVSHKAKRDLNDYIPLCASCHKVYDLEARRSN